MNPYGIDTGPGDEWAVVERGYANPEDLSCWERYGWLDETAEIAQAANAGESDVSPVARPRRLHGCQRGFRGERMRVDMKAGTGPGAAARALGTAMAAGGLLVCGLVLFALAGGPGPTLKDAVYLFEALAPPFAVGAVAVAVSRCPWRWRAGVAAGAAGLGLLLVSAALAASMGDQRFFGASGAFLGLQAVGMHMEVALKTLALAAPPALLFVGSFALGRRGESGCVRIALGTECLGRDASGGDDDESGG